MVFTFCSLAKCAVLFCEARVPCWFYYWEHATVDGQFNERRRCAVAMAIVLFFLPGITGLVSVMEMPKTDSARVAASSLERTRFRFNPYSEWHIHGTKERSTLKDPHKEDQSELVGYVGNTLQLHKRHGFRRDLTRFRTQNFEFSKISVRNQLRITRNRTRHSMLTLATDVRDL